MVQPAKLRTSTARSGRRTTALPAFTGSTSPPARSRPASRSRAAGRAAQYLRRHSGFAEQRLLHRLPPASHRAHRRQDRRGQAVRDPDAGIGAAPRHDGCAGPAVVRRISRRPHRHVRHQDRAVQGMAGRRRAGRRPTTSTIDKNEEAWTGSMLSDQVTRLNTKTGEASTICCRARPTSGACSSTIRRRRSRSGSAATMAALVRIGLRSVAILHAFSRRSCRSPLCVPIHLIQTMALLRIADTCSRSAAAFMPEMANHACNAHGRRLLATTGKVMLPSNQLVLLQADLLASSNQHPGQPSPPARSFFPRGCRRTRARYGGR